MEFLFRPWPWYVAGPIIGLTVPALLLLGNKRFGISSTLRQICAACYPANISFLKYDWKADEWNLFFVAGVLLGGFLGGYVLANPNPVDVSNATLELFSSYGLQEMKELLPEELFNWNELTTVRGFILMVVGGFLVGFGTRYARGCTSGHGIFGLSALQWTSLIAVISFFIGGILISHFVLPYILTL